MKAVRRTALLAVILAVVFAAASPAAPPGAVIVQGVLTDGSGRGLTGDRAYRVRFYDAPTGGGPLGGAVTGVISVPASGRFAIAVAPPAAVVGAAGEVWYELAVDSASPPDGAIDPGDVFPDRVEIASVLFAQRAAGADALTGPVTDAQVPDDITVEHADTATTSHYAATASMLEGEAFVMVGTTDDPRQDAANLLAAYDVAKGLAPYGQALSSANRAAVIVPPGRYDLGTDALNLDAEFVDLIGLTTDREKQHIYGEAGGLGTGVLEQTANDVRIENLLVECSRSSGGVNPDDPAAYFPTGASTDTVVINCRFLRSGKALSTRARVDYPGTYRSCQASLFSFGYEANASGTFTDCTGGSGSFGGGGGTASGIFTNCTGAFAEEGTASGTFTDCTGSFADGGTASGTFADCTGSFADGGTASGTFTNCRGGTGSFGGAGGTASGSFMNCSGGNAAFGGAGGIVDGTFTDCSGGAESFGGRGGTASGTFENCAGGFSSFGGDGGKASGTFTNCSGGSDSFGGDGGTASGVFENCRGGDNSYGGDGGVATGVFRYCVGGSQSFAGDFTVPGHATGGIFYYCEGGDASFTTNGTPTVIHCIRDGAPYP